LVAALLAFAVPAVAQTAPGPVGQPSGQWREQIYWVPYTNQGQTYLLYTRVCRPPGEAPARVVVVAHGTPPSTGERATMTPLSCESEAAQWFLGRGFAIVASMRVSYGSTGGPIIDSLYECDRGPRDYARNSMITASQIAATIDYAATLPFVRPTGMVVVGVSAGGIGSVAYDSMPHPRVTAIIDFAGGHGGHYRNTPNSNCQPEQLAVAAGTLARGATTPMLWIYAANDSYFNPQIAASMYAAYSQNGGTAQFYQLGPFGEDGHRLFTGRGGSAIWGPLVERYLATRPTQ